MPTDPTTLAAEIASGPLAAELAPLVAAGSDADIAGLLNARSDSWTVYRMLYRADLLGVIVATGNGPALDAAAATDSAAWALRLMLGDPASYVDMADPQNQGFAMLLDGGVPGLGTAILGVSTRPASRTEVLFGRGAAVSADDVSAALGRPRQ